MGTKENPNPNQNRAQTTNPNPSPNPNPVTTHVPKIPSFEEVSALFSLPLSDAAESLGVSSSILKNVCYENGLVRWPYRKFVAGKSIEEIKKEVAIEKGKQSSASNVSKKSGHSLASLPLSSSLQPQSKNAGSRMGVQQHSKEGSQSTQGITMNRGNSAVSDEFKYGFPSQGLSTVSYRWWGNKDDGPTTVKQETATTQVTTYNEKQAETKYASLLRWSREKAARDCGKALKLGVHRCNNPKTLDKQKQMVLLQIFQSSLPAEWGYLSSSAN